MATVRPPDSAPAHRPREEEYPAFSVQLWQYRTERGWTQDELAERAGLSARGIRALEQGERHRPQKHTVRLLADALDLSGQERTRFEEAAQRSSPVAPAGTASTRHTLTVAETNLPVEPTPFIGREREVAAIVDLLRHENVRLITLTGPGGTGKTRLAIEAARDLLDAFPDGVIFVQLGTLADPALVASTVAAVLKVKERPGYQLVEALQGYLREKRLLLLLDNFEHLLDACWLVSELLAACRQLKVLATSRAVLHLAAEHDYSVPPLPVPPASQRASLGTLVQYDAVALFVERARAAKASFSLTGDNAPAVAEICRRLDGLPLAIELAAARTRLFPPQALLQRLSNRLQLLTGGARDLPARQQTLRAAIDWSYSLLTEEEQTLFARLSVFAAGCTFEAAEAVCNEEGDLDLVEGIASLIGKSLLRQEGEEQPRFRMLETIREHAWERLEDSGERDDLSRRHAQWYLALAEEAATELRGPRQAECLACLEAEHDNLRAALQWAGDSGEAEPGLRLAVALSRFWKIRGYLGEGQHWLTELLTVAGGVAPLLRAAALLKAGELIFSQGRDREAAELLERSLVLYRELGDRQGTTEALGRLADALLNRGDEERAVALLTEHVTLGRTRGDKPLLATSLCCLAGLADLHGDADRARMLGEESVVLFRELGDVKGTADALQIMASAAYREGDLLWARALTEEIIALLRRSNLDEETRVWCEYPVVWTARDRGDYSQAKRLLEALEARALELGDTWNAAYTRLTLGVLAREQGDYDRARALVRESLVVFQEAEDLWRTGRALVALSDVSRDQGDPEGVIEPCEQALVLFRQVDEVPSLWAGFALHNLGLAARHQADYERAEALLAGSLAVFRQRGDAGAVAEALSSVGLVALEQGQPERAHQAFVESLMIARTWTLGTVLEGLAGAAVGQGHAVRAARLFGAAEAVRATMRTPILPTNQALYQRHTSLTQEALGDEPFTRAWEEGRTMSLEQAVAYALEEAAD